MTTITVSGTPGSGKSTVCQLLSQQLAIPYIYSGDMFRNMATQYKMSLAEFGRYCEHHDEIDRKLDEQQLEILKKGNVILEGRIAGWIAYRNDIPALKIIIDADIDIRAGRIVKREQGTIEERKRDIIQRAQSEYKRYKTYYDIDLNDTSIYDLVIDSGHKTPEEIVDGILRFLQ